MSTRRSVPTKGISRYLASNWSYIMPDFNVPHHSIIEWNGMGEPQEPGEELSSDTLPDWDDLRGVAPDATGDLSSEEFVRRLRSEWDRDDAEKLAADVLAEFLGANG